MWGVVKGWFFLKGGMEVGRKGSGRRVRRVRRRRPGCVLLLLLLGVVVCVRVAAA